MKNIKNSSHAYTDDANKACNDITDILNPLVEKLYEDGWNMESIYYLICSELEALICKHEISLKFRGQLQLR